MKKYQGIVKVGPSKRNTFVTVSANNPHDAKQLLDSKYGKSNVVGHAIEKKKLNSYNKKRSNHKSTRSSIYASSKSSPSITGQILGGLQSISYQGTYEARSISGDDFFSKLQQSNEDIIESIPILDPIRTIFSILIIVFGIFHAFGASSFWIFVGWFFLLQYFIQLVMLY